jgi:rRNA small subunit pseudouridine methyltransferase Nep1
MAKKNKTKRKDEQPEDEHDDNGDKQQQVQQETTTTNTEPQPPTKRSKLAATPLEIATAGLDHRSAKQVPKQSVIVLLDQASLETVKNNKNIFELLNCDDHRDICRKKLKRDPNEFRPDILHGELLSLLDSPINKAGHLKIYIQTTKHVLIDVNPAIRIPRTYKRFAGLMVQLLHKMKIKAGNDSTTLLKVIKNPFSSHLPAGTRCYGMSCQGKLYSPIALAQSLATAPSPDEQASTQPLCFIVGAMSTGHVKLEDHPYMEEMFSISEYPLSGASALARIMGGLEHHWGIV